MKKFRYIGLYVRTYPDILDPPNGSLVVKPGDVREFDVPPSDGLWLAEAEPKPASPPKPAQGEEKK